MAGRKRAQGSGGSDRQARRDRLRRALMQAVLDGPGDTPPALRRAVAAHAASTVAAASAAFGAPVDSAASGAPGAFPAALDDYVDKVTHRAYRVMDEDVTALRQAGYSDDAIFEITLGTALGASMGRLARGLQVVADHRAGAPAGPGAADAPDDDAIG